MPQHAPPKTLKNLAFENIIKHVDSVWTSQYVKDWGNKHLLYVEGPFDILTPADCHWILSELAMRKILKRHHIYLLINPYLKILNLSDFRDASKIKLILDLALTRCSRLKKIVLKYSQDFSTLFMPYLEILNNLTELELPNTRLNNYDVGVIGIHAPNVKLLNLEDTRFSDNGLKSLFLSLDPDGNEDQAYGQCQQVEILDIRGVEISPKCAAEIYALRVNKWRNFKVDKTFNVIMECLQNYPEVESFKTDYLRFQTIEYDEIKLESYIQGALLLASDASDIRLEDIDVHEDNVGQGLSMVRNFKRITNLTMDMREDFKTPTLEHPFERGITPILISHGPNLSELMFTFVKDLDLGIVASYCTGLKELKLQYNTYSTANTKFEIALDWPLENLVIQCSSHPITGVFHNSPEISIFKRILAGAVNLDTLVVQFCDTFTDEVFIHACKFNPFDKLTELMLTNCKNITMKALEGTVLMKNNVPLKNVLLFCCDEITLSDFNRYRKYVKTNNYKVEVQWK